MNKKYNNKRVIMIFSPLFFYSHYSLATCNSNGNILTTDNTLYYCSGNIEIYDEIIINTSIAGGITPLQGFGIYADGDRNLKEVDIMTSASAADGIQVNKRGDLTFDKLTVKTSGSSADGINVTENLTVNATVNTGNNTYIEAQSGVGVRANVSKVAGTTNTINVGSNATIITYGSANGFLGANAYDALGYGVYAGIRSWKASTAIGNAKVTIGDNSTITTNGSLSHAAYANSGGKIQLGSINITTHNRNAYGLYAESSDAGSIIKGSTIDLLGDVTINVPTSGIAIYANGVDSIIASKNSDTGVLTSGVFNINGVIKADDSGAINLSMATGSNIQGNIQSTNNGLVELNMANGSSMQGYARAANNGFIHLNLADGSYIQGNIQSTINGLADVNMADGSSIQGNIQATNTGLINVNMASGSIIQGNIQATNNGHVELNMINGAKILGSSTISDGGQIDIDIDGELSQWVVSSDSTLTNLNLTNNAKTVLGDHQVALDGTNSVTLTTNTLNGNGIFMMRSVIDGTNNFHDLIQVTDANASAGEHQIMINDSQSGSATVDGSERVMLVQTEGGTARFTSTVDIGANTYNLDKGDLEFGERETDWHLRKLERSNPANNSVTIVNINYLMNYIENQTILQRLGELRQTQNEGGDVWGRIYTGTLNSFENANFSDSKLRYSGFQLGVDKNVNSTDLWDVYVGLIAGMSKGMTDFKVGDGNTTTYYAGFYGTYKEYNGFYLDLIAKYMYMDNKFNTQTSGGYAVNGSGDSQGYSIGLEFGKRFWLNKPTINTGSWFIEPQGQFTYGYQSSATIKSNNGLKTKLHEFDSVLGRISSLFGYTTYDKNNNQVDLYIKLGYVKEYDGDTSYTFNGTDKESYSFKGHWIDTGIGINTQISKQHNLYFDLNYAAGKQFNQRQVNLGYRYNF
ncbi:autotransporter outer membrane beta-barrel domain-containing protein [Orbus wheelerorum]|uniref:autotransporter outer membrane beta-barrel domain-containing protein n=1 Tax=Orbus wheelerorum TaxID=3074111 RepID=UPI00370D56AE